MKLHELMAAVVKLASLPPNTPVERYMHSAEADAHDGGCGTDPVEEVELVRRVRFVKDWTFSLLNVPITIKGGRVYDVAGMKTWNPQPPEDAIERFDVIVIR